VSSQRGPSRTTRSRRRAARRPSGHGFRASETTESVVEPTHRRTLVYETDRESHKARARGCVVVTVLFGRRPAPKRTEPALPCIGGQRPSPYPKPLARQVLVESGHRCAIPTCRATTTEIAHIVPWAKVREHAFENLIALCPNCHTRYDKNEIDRRAMLMYKRNLGLLTRRYGEAERRLLEMFVQAPPGSVGARFDRAMDFELMYLLRDGLLEKVQQQGGVLISGVRHGPEEYVLTEQGVEFVNHLVRL
jgi:5-methylcytosine-specific restriction endonuclease McrA